jgi:hypothetical protein
VLAVTGTEVVGNFGQGSFTQTGGTHTVNGTLMLGSGSNSSGVYTLTGGALAATTTTINFNGTVFYSGGTLAAGNLSLTGNGKLLLSAGAGTTLAASNFTSSAAASLDLSDERMFLSYTGGTANANLILLRQYLHAGELFSSTSGPLGYADPVPERSS